jgi:protein-tyrosine phosphatase
MKGPLSRGSSYLETDEIALAPEMYVATLRQLGVTCVVRLNEPDTYDKGEFERAGIAHHDLYFDDCTAPPDAVVQRFLDICDGEGRVAVHCRAGLGRTGTLVGVWLMKQAGFGADEAMGWLRIVRPGSVIGPQQHYLKACEGRLWRGNSLEPSEGAAPSSEQAATSAGAAASSRTTAAHVTAGMVARGAAKAAAASSAAAAPHAADAVTADGRHVPGLAGTGAAAGVWPGMAAAAFRPSYLRRALQAAAAAAATAAAAAAAKLSSGAAAARMTGPDGGREHLLKLPVTHAWVRRGSWREARGLRRRWW